MNITDVSKNNLISKKIDNSLQEKNRKIKGIILWLLILSGYFLFVFNWMIMNSLAGTVSENGWLGEYFTDEPSTLMTNTVNWSITLMRGIGALFAGWLLVKIGHRYSVIVAFSFLCVATITSFMPYYSLFILGRMLMAVGGTVLIVYTQPIIANYFQSSKDKNKLNITNSLAFNFGSIFAFLPFLFPVIGDPMVDNWQLWSTIFASAAIILLIAYVLVSRGENPVRKLTKLEAIEAKKDPNFATLGTVLKEKRTWYFGISYAFWLTTVVTMITLVSKVFGTYVDPIAVKTWYIAFLIGLIPGIFLIGPWGSSMRSRKPFIITIILLGIISAAIAVPLAMFAEEGESSAPIMFAFSVLFIFISGACLWGIQGVFLGMTYGYKGATPQKQGIVMGSIWGIGYIGNTILTIILSVIFDASQTAFISVFFLMCLATVAVFMLVPETHKNGKLINT